MHCLFCKAYACLEMANVTKSIEQHLQFMVFVVLKQECDAYIVWCVIVFFIIVAYQNQEIMKWIRKGILFICGDKQCSTNESTLFIETNTDLSNAQVENKLLQIIICYSNSFSFCQKNSRKYSVKKLVLISVIFVI